MIGYGVCVGSWEEFQRYITPRTQSRPLIALSGQISIAVAYNTILDAYARSDLDGVMLVHTDLEIIDPDAEGKILRALAQDDVALVGVAGGGGRNGTMWWDDNPIGHQQTDARLIDFGRREGDVEILEGSLLAFSPWAVAHLRFDETLPGFQTCDEIGLQATRGHGRRCVVVDLDSYHHTQEGFKTEKAREDWSAAHEAVLRKWSGG